MAIMKKQIVAVSFNCSYTIKIHIAETKKKKCPNTFEQQRIIRISPDIWSFPVKQRIPYNVTYFTLN